MLKVNGHGILNLLDLQRTCPVWQIMEQMGEFRSFAEVHCVPLPLLFTTTDGKRKRASYLTKAFWLSLLPPKPPLKENLSEKEWVEYIVGKWAAQYEPDAAVPEDIMREVIMEAEYEKIMEKAAALLNLKNQDINLTGNELVTILAVCMLAELDMDKITSSVRRQGAPKGGYPASHGSTQSILPVETPDNRNRITLTASSTPYRYLLFEDNRMPDKGMIKTVCVEAVGSQNEFERVMIQVYSEKENKVVWEFNLNKGEYRYCNIIQGKIIKFLPSMCIGKRRCIYRHRYNSSDLIVEDRYGGGENKTILEYGGGVSSFGTGAEGDIFICSGSLMLSRYRPYMSNPAVKMKLDGLMMLSECFVEVSILDDKYMLLTDWGGVYSNDRDMDGKSGVVSLEDTDWRMKPGNASGVRECQTDNALENLVYRTLAKDQCKIIWDNKEHMRYNNGILTADDFKEA